MSKVQASDMASELAEVISKYLDELGAATVMKVMHAILIDLHIAALGATVHEAIQANKADAEPTSQQ